MAARKCFQMARRNEPMPSAVVATSAFQDPNAPAQDVGDAAATGFRTLLSSAELGSCMASGALESMALTTNRKTNGPGGTEVDPLPDVPLPPQLADRPWLNRFSTRPKHTTVGEVLCLGSGAQFVLSECGEELVPLGVPPEQAAQIASFSVFYDCLEDLCSVIAGDGTTGDIAAGGASSGPRVPNGGGPFAPFGSARGGRGGAATRVATRRHADTQCYLRGLVAEESQDFAAFVGLGDFCAVANPPDFGAAVGFFDQVHVFFEWTRIKFSCCGFVLRLYAIHSCSNSLGRAPTQQLIRDRWNFACYAGNGASRKPTAPAFVQRCTQFDDCCPPPHRRSGSILGVSTCGTGWRALAWKFRRFLARKMRTKTEGGRVWSTGPQN